MAGKSLPSQRTGNQKEKVESRGRTGGIRADVLTYFHQRPGQRIFLSEIVKDLNLLEVQIQQAITTEMRRDPDCGIEVHVRGHEWSWKPAEKKEAADEDGKRIFVEVGKTKAGTLIIESEDGVLYKAIELDL